MNNYWALQDRIAKLRAHIRSRRGRCDRQALKRLVELRQENERHRVSALKTSTLDLVLQELYSDEALLETITKAPPWFSFLKKDENVPMNRAYVIPVWLEPGMARAICPDCEELIEITPNGKDPRVTFRRQRLMLHPNKKRPGELCPGGGKDV